MRMFIGIMMFWFSIFGYLLYFKKKSKLPNELLLPIIFSLIGITVFISGILNMMYIISVLIYLVGNILFFKYLYKKKIEFKKLLNPNFIILLIIFIYISIIGSKMRLLHYDNFSHWGLIIKNMFLNNRLPNFEDTIIEFKNYQPGSACFMYFFGVIAGKTEASMIVSQNYLLISYIFSLFAFLNTKIKGFKSYIPRILIICFYIFMLFSNISINDLLVDTLIASMSICSFSIMYYFKNNLKKAYIYNLPILIFLFLVKNTGIVLVGFSCLGLIYLGYKNKKLKKGILYALLSGIISCAFFYIWSRHVLYVYGDIGLESRHSLSISNIISQLRVKGLENILAFCKLYLKNFFNISNNLINKYMININIIIILMIIFYKKHRKHFLSCLLISNILYLLYYGILGVMYLFSMPWSEAIILAGFYRYMMTIISIIIGIVLLYFIEIIIKEKKLTKPSLLISSCFIVCILFVNIKYYIKDYNILIGNLNYENMTAYKYDKILGSSMFNADDNDFYYIYAPKTSQNDYGLTYYLSKYKLNTKNLQVINNISQINNKSDNSYTKNIIILDETDDIYEYIYKNEYENVNGLYKKEANN